MNAFEKKFWDRVNITENCWDWLAGKNSCKYGVMNYLGQVTSVYRWLWEKDNEFTPKGKELHHICHNRSCVNPAHLKAVSRGLHLRMEPRNLRKDNKCKRGHEMTPENTRVQGRFKACKECGKLISRKHHLRRRKELEESRNQK